MDPGNHSGLVASPEMAMPGNLDILAQTAASQSVDTGSLQDNSSFSGISVLRLSENAPVTLPLLNQPIRIEGQPGGPMLSQPQIQKLLGSSEPDKGLSPGPLSIITTTGFSEPGQPSPASLAQNAQILQYRQSVTSGDAMLSAINYSDSEILHENFDNLGNLDDGLLGGMGNPSRLSENPTSETFNLFDGDGDSLTMEALSPGLIISDSGGLAGVNTVTDSNDSNPGDPSLADDKKKPARPKKPLKGQVSPGKGGALECNQCHKVFNNTSALAKHKLTHSDERKYVCTICEKKFKRQDHLNGHLMTHRDKKPYQCMVTGCDKSYCDARSLRRHLENHHHHTSEQIATEMVAAQSTAADVLAEVTMVPSAKSSLTGSAPTNNNVVKSSSNSAVQLTESTPVRVVISDTTKLINIHPSGQAGVATTVSLPINIQVSNKDLNQIAQSTTVIPLETVLKQQHTQLVQEAGKKDKSTSEQNSTEILAVSSLQ